MRKKFVLVLMSVMMTFLCTLAKEPLRVQNLEGELFLGMNTAIDNHKGMSSMLGFGYGIELRKNLKDSPFDVGVLLGGSHIQHRYYSEWGKERQNDNMMYLAAVGDYNFRQGRKINPYAGLGLGVAVMDYASGDPVHINGFNAVFTPRVGVEFAHHIRVGASLILIRKGFNSFNLSLGFVIGGRPKKVKSVN